MDGVADIWSTLGGWWEALKPYLGWLYLLFAGAGLVLTSWIAKVGYKIYWYSKCRELIRRVLTSQDGRPLDVGRKMRIMAEADVLRWSLTKRRPLEMARRLVELEIINPSKPKPHRDDYDPSAYEDALKEWEHEEEERIKNLVKDLTQIMDVPSDFEHDWNIRTISKGAARFLFRIVGRPYKDASKSELGALRPQRLPSLADLDRRRASIARYFRVLKDIRPAEPRLFSTEVHIENGFLAPIFLLTGTLSRFDEETGWKLIIDQYRKLVRDDRVHSAETTELRAFLFNCWLLWGPSIPQCGCDCWKTQSSFGAVYQYGYGDENQSIDLFVRNGSGPDLRGKLDVQTGSRRLARLAAPYGVRGRFRLGADLTGEEVCGVQGRIVKGGDDASEGRIVLECKPDGFQEIADNDSSNYYSAYLWIIFVLLDENGNPYFDGEERWKNLLCFFEHGNIAVASTYQTLKKSLAIKAVNSISEILEREKGIGIAYACALDDSNCRGGLKYRPDSKVPRIVDIVVSQIQEGDFPVARDALSKGVLRVPTGNEACENNPYSSCALPDLVADFYRQLSRSNEGS
jgi:hypothetical protein